MDIYINFYSFYLIQTHHIKIANILPEKQPNISYKSWHIE